MTPPLPLTSTPLPLLSHYTFRPMVREDAEAVHAMLVEAAQADRREPRDLDDFLKNFDDPWMDPASDSLLALDPGGAPAALGLVFADPHPADQGRAFLEGEVHPAHRKRGLGREIQDWMETRGGQKLRALTPAGRERWMRVACQDDGRDRIALVERRGFNIIRYFYRMRRDLSLPIPERPLPAGLTLQAYAPDVDERLFQAFNESFADHWDFVPATRHDWQVFVIGRESFRPDLTCVVMDGDEVAGYSLNRVSQEENARSGAAEGWIGTLGVRRPWRKRGLASAMLCHSMRAFQAQGLAFAKLGVDAENLTGALRLYEQLGFVVQRRFIVFAREVR